VLFTGVNAGQANAGSEALSNFATGSHVYGVSANFAASERLDLSFMLQQVRSSSVFAPQLTVFSATNNTFGIREITEQDTVISQASARGEIRLTSKLSSSLEYSWSDYHEKNSVASASNGTVNSVLAYLTAKW